MTCSEDMLIYVHFILCLGGNDRQKRLKCLKNTLRNLRGTGLTKRVMHKNKAFNELVDCFLKKNKSKQNKKQTKLNKTSQTSSYYS